MKKLDKNKKYVFSYEKFKRNKDLGLISDFLPFKEMDGLEAEFIDETTVALSKNNLHLVLNNDDFLIEKKEEEQVKELEVYSILWNPKEAEIKVIFNDKTCRTRKAKMNEPAGIVGQFALLIAEQIYGGEKELIDFINKAKVEEIRGL